MKPLKPEDIISTDKLREAIDLLCPEKKQELINASYDIRGSSLLTDTERDAEEYTLCVMALFERIIKAVPMDADNMCQYIRNMEPKAEEDEDNLPPPWAANETVDPLLMAQIQLETAFKFEDPKEQAEAVKNLVVAVQEKRNAAARENPKPDPELDDYNDTKLTSAVVTYQTCIQYGHPIPTDVSNAIFDVLWDIHIEHATCKFDKCIMKELYNDSPDKDALVAEMKRLWDKYIASGRLVSYYQERYNDDIRKYTLEKLVHLLYTRFTRIFATAKQHERNNLLNKLP